MARPHKNTVQDGYDQIAEKYLVWAQTQPSTRLQYTEKVLKHASSASRILELGCGAGIPVTQRLQDHVIEGGGEVVANDISARQIELARAYCPRAHFIEGDMTRLHFEPESFDLVVSFFAIFHLPRKEQETMFARIHDWLRPGGHLVCNLAVVDEPEIRGEFLGVDMFWSSYNVEKNKAILGNAGFELVEQHVLKAGEDLDPSDPDYEMEFLWIIAHRIVGSGVVL